MKPIQSVVYGCDGLTLSDWEKSFFAEQNPFGFIVFKRNVESPEQLRSLCQEFRNCVGDSTRPVFVDQEGGRVARLRPPHWPQLPPMARIGYLYDVDPETGKRASFLVGQILGDMLSDIGINVDCAPVLDLKMPETHDVIGDRAFHHDPVIVACLAEEFARGLMSFAVFPVIKHLPGHGRTMVDSHYKLPVISASMDILQTDHKPFQMLNNMLFGMSGHLLLTAYDPNLPATLSPDIIAKVIRQHIGFKGLLLSDDISMHALSGSYRERVVSAYEAGCDIILHCNGAQAEMVEIATVTQSISPDNWQKWQLAWADLLKHSKGKASEHAFEKQQAMSELTTLLSYVIA